MHISEGILSGEVLAVGTVLAVAGTAIGLKKLDYDKIAGAGILASAFFVASLIHYPVGPSSVHLIMNGVVGLILGWGAFPAMLAALTLHAVMFQYGGITVLGVNTLIMAVPAVLCYGLFRRFALKGGRVATAAAFLTGFCAVLFGAVLTGAALMFTGKEFLEVTVALVGSYFPIMIIEGIITVFCVEFLKKVQPEMLG